MQASKRSVKEVLFAWCYIASENASPLFILERDIVCYLFVVVKHLNLPVLTKRSTLSFGESGNLV